MTLYYQIVKNQRGNGDVFYTVRKAWNIFGLVCSPSVFDRWVSKNPEFGGLFSFRESAGKCSSLEDAHEAAQIHAKAILKGKADDYNNVKSKVIDLVKISEYRKI